LKTIDELDKVEEKERQIRVERAIAAATAVLG
jgi:hypothetical protein